MPRLTEKGIIPQEVLVMAYEEVLLKPLVGKKKVGSYTFSLY
jgi:hypothetical protein